MNKIMNKLTDGIITIFCLVAILFVYLLAIIIMIFTTPPVLVALALLIVWLIR